MTRRRRRRQGGLVGGVLAVATAVAVAAPVAADEIRISMERGRVTLIAAEAPLADVLAAWARVGDVRFEGAGTLEGEPVTLHLIDVAEAEALRLLLRGAAGYVAAPRRTGAPGIARHDRVKILAARGAPAPEPSPATTDSRAPTSGPATPDSRAPSPDPAAPGTPMPREDLQRLLDAMGANPLAGLGAAAATAPAVAPSTGSAPTAPFPGMVTDPGGSRSPEQERRGRRPRPGGRFLRGR